MSRAVLAQRSDSETAKPEEQPATWASKKGVHQNARRSRRVTRIYFAGVRDLRGCENRGELRFHKGQSRVDCGVVIVAPVWFYSVADLRAPQALMAKYLKPEREVGAHVEIGRAHV